MSNTIAADPFASLNAANAANAGSTTAANDAGSADRFLKLLVTQMQNQDPLNPMDNAQITSQMAQINTVSGLQTLNGTVQGLNAQFVQLQALQGASLVGREVTLQGNRVDIDGSTGSGGFEIGASADNVKVEILNPAGRVVETLDLGAQGAGRHDFSWNAAQAPAGVEYHFKVTATNGTTALASTSLTRDQVDAISTSGSGLVLQTRHSGDIAYSDVKAFN